MEKSSNPCPKCGQHFSIGEATCSVCGFIFNKAGGPPHLEEHWQKLIHSWDRDESHQEFLLKCSTNLNFASQKYRLLLEADPHNEKALEMQKRIYETVTLNLSEPEKKVPHRPLVYSFLLAIIVIVLIASQMPKNILVISLPMIGTILVGLFAIRFMRQRWL